MVPGWAEDRGRVWQSRLRLGGEEGPFQVLSGLGKQVAQNQVGTRARLS